MISKRTALTLILSAIVVIGTMAAIKNPRVRSHLLLQQQVTAFPGSLNWYAQTAQAQGASSYSFPAGIFEYFIPPTWNDVLAENSFVIVEPVESKSYAENYGGPEDNTIITWYRFRVIEFLSRKDAVISVPAPPADMTPAQANEIILSKYGGSLVINGVTLTSVDFQFPEFVAGQRYLIIYHYMDPTTKDVDAAMGGDGIFTIDSSGIMRNVLTSMPSLFQGEVNARYGGSVDQLRAALANAHLC